MVKEERAASESEDVRACQGLRKQPSQAQVHVWVGGKRQGSEDPDLDSRLQDAGSQIAPRKKTW